MYQMLPGWESSCWIDEVCDNCLPALSLLPDTSHLFRHFAKSENHLLVIWRLKIAAVFTEKQTKLCVL